MEWLVFSLLAAFLMGVGIILDKRVLMHGHSLDFAFLISAVGLVFALPLLFLAEWSLAPVVLAFIVLIGITHAIGIWFFLKTLHHAQVSSASVFIAFSPIFVFLFSLVLIGESLRVFQLAGLGLIVAGAYVLRSHVHEKSLLDPFISLARDKAIYSVLIFLSLFAVSAVLSRFLLAELAIDPLFVLGASHVVDVLALGVLFSVFHRERAKVLVREWRSKWFLVILIGIFAVGESLAGLFALRSAEGLTAVVMSLKRLGLLIPIIVGGELFHEGNLVKKTIAVLIMIGGSLLLVWSF